tara:strand:- start:590 stop:979 length:390 start_codon:yes stop_codon:yes gene_type:complete
MKTTLLSFLALCLMSISVHPEDKGPLDRLKELYDEKVEGGKALSARSKEWIKGDIENMGDWEYKIVPFGEVAAAELEKKLNQLGSERWQCFWVEANGKSKTFYFKRTKLSYINKIPAADLLRLLRDSEE